MLKKAKGMAGSHQEKRERERERERERVLQLPLWWFGFRGGVVSHLPNYKNQRLEPKQLRVT